jgi:ATP-binding cassette subfamily B protein
MESPAEDSMPPRHPDHLDERDLPPAGFTRQTLADAWQMAGYLRPYRWRFAASLVGLTLGSLMTLALPYVIGLLINSALAAGEADVPWHRSINGVALLLVGVLAVQAVLSFAYSYGLQTVSENTLADLRRDTYVRMLRLPLAFHTRRRVGELASRIAADLTQIQETLVFALPHLLRQVAVLLGGVTLIALTSGRLTLLMLGSVPVMFVLAVLFGRRIRRHARDAQDRLAESNVIVEETLQGIATVKAFTGERYEEGRYRGSLDRYLTAILRSAVHRSLFVSFIVFALFGSIVLVLWYGARLVQTGSLSVGELTSFMLYTVFVGGAVGSFAELFTQLQRTLGATQRVRELLREELEPETVPVQPSVNGPVPQRLHGEVVFEGVCFRYPSRPEALVLDNVSLTIHAGQRVALVGPSGAGKSTIAALVLRFYDPEKGRILLDGRDARTLPLTWLRGQMAIVPQEVLLFGGTIAENIGYGRPGASEAEIMDAARLANAHEFISAFPDGYATRVGERGVQLSGGQRQRVAIARALLRNPSVLILDEATSALDAENEGLVLEALDRLMEGRTCLVIAHRLSTVRRADRIYVLKEGRTVEAGTHEELVQQTNGVYRSLTERQRDLV